jgi:periplasmic glucans biosynthesis protein
MLLLLQCWDRQLSWHLHHDYERLALNKSSLRASVAKLALTPHADEALTMNLPPFSRPFALTLALMLMSLSTHNFGCAARSSRSEVSLRTQSAAQGDRSASKGLGMNSSSQTDGEAGRGKTEPASVLPRQFDTLVARARAARNQAYVPQPEAFLPDTLRNIDWATYRTIRFRPEQALWRAQPGHFEAQFFHLGFIYRTPVGVFVVEGERTERLPFSIDQFRYDGVPPPQRTLPLGYAGLRLHTNLNSDGYRDETIVFQGASYFRSLGRGNAFGLSARALAIDTGESVPEEFPRFTELHMVKPAAEERSIWVLAALDSPRVTGACAFLITPGENTHVEVTLQLFFREPVHVLGLAPFSSMHLFGEASPHRFDAARPEVHDSDGLALHTRAGERMLRPLDNPVHTRVTNYRLDSPRGFGLLQRDRNSDSYRDGEQRYEARPSAWVEPIGDWGNGQLRLLEFATALESDDNIATLWVPDQAPRDELHVQYRLSFGSDVEHAAFGRVVATRKIAQGEGRARFELDFAVPNARALSGPVELVLTTPGAEVLSREVAPSNDGFRARFELARTNPDEKTELRAFLRSASDVLTETWSYPWQAK